VRSVVQVYPGPPAFARSARYGSASHLVSEPTERGFHTSEGEGCPAGAFFAEAGLSLKCVYILQSLQKPAHFYTVITDDLKARLSKHNSGAVTHTAKHRPWRAKSYVAFSDGARALAFAKYLKSGSGQAFAKTHHEREHT
jgi:putative endonuclease